MMQPYKKPQRTKRVGFPVARNICLGECPFCDGIVSSDLTDLKDMNDISEDSTVLCVTRCENGCQLDDIAFPLPSESNVAVLKIVSEARNKWQWEHDTIKNIEPCAHCGSRPEWEFSDDYVKVQCPHCSWVRKIGRGAQTLNGLARNWNRSQAG